MIGWIALAALGGFSAGAVVAAIFGRQAGHIQGFEIGRVHGAAMARADFDRERQRDRARRHVAAHGLKIALGLDERGGIEELFSEEAGQFDMSRMAPADRRRLGRMLILTNRRSKKRANR